MGKTALVDHDLKAGEKLISKLDQKNFPFVAALWLFDPDAEDWRFIIATELVETLGSTKTYKRLHPFLAEFQEFSHLTATGLTPKNVTVVSPTNELIRLLARTVKTGPGPDVSHIRLTNNAINGIFIEDAYIYRLHLPPRKNKHTVARKPKRKGTTRKARAG